MNFTDLITFLLSLYFMILGLVRGFVQSLMVPFSIVVATVLSVFVYQITKNMILSLIVALIGPLLVNLLLKFLLKIWVKATNSDIEQPGFLSRLGGGALSLAWGWTFIIFTLILIAVFPPWGKALTTVHEDVGNSISYNYIAKPVGKVLFAASGQSTPVVTNQTAGSDAKSLAQDPRFQKILQDPKIQQAIDAHDMKKLISNPKMMDLVQQIMSDPATMKKVMSLYNSQTDPQTAKNP